MAAPGLTADAAETAERSEHAQQRFGVLQRVFGALSDNPYYRLYWTGNQANTLVQQMQQVANGYLAYTLTGSAAALGVVAIAQSAPMLVFSPIGGVLADRLEKRNLLIWMQAVQCLISLLIGVLVATDRIEYWHLVVTAAIQGLSFAVIGPTRQSWIPQLVSRDDLTSALALNNAGMNASRVIGPSLAGILIAVPWFGVDGVYFLRVFAFGWVLFSLLQIPILGAPEARAAAGHGMERVRDFGAQLTSGLRYIWRHETLLSLFIFAVVTMLLGQSYQQLLPAYALGVFNVGRSGPGGDAGGRRRRRAGRLAVHGVPQPQPQPRQDPGVHRYGAGSGVDAVRRVLGVQLVPDLARGAVPGRPDAGLQRDDQSDADHAEHRSRAVRTGDVRCT